MVHTLNVVHLKVVPDDRRERARDARRRAFLDAALRVVDRDGLRGVTMQAVADELDCAVGTIYTYFPSKAALVTALGAHAVETLRASYRAAHERWSELLAPDDLPAELGALVELCAFGSFWVAASVVLRDEFDLQRHLLSEQVTLRTTDDVADALPVVLSLLEQPRALVESAVAHGALTAGDPLGRVLRWVAALNGVLLLDALAPVDRHLFRAGHHARALTAELLVGWGAERSTLEVASSHVERLAAGGPMAPRPDGDPWA